MLPTATHVALILVVLLGTLPPAAADEPDSRSGETWLTDVFRGSVERHDAASGPRG
jgi:hypothetical protein